MHIMMLYAVACVGLARKGLRKGHEEHQDEQRQADRMALRYPSKRKMTMKFAMAKRHPMLEVTRRIIENPSSMRYTTEPFASVPRAAGKPQRSLSVELVEAEGALVDQPCPIAEASARHLPILPFAEVATSASTPSSSSEGSAGRKA